MYLTKFSSKAWIDGGPKLLLKINLFFTLHGSPALKRSMCNSGLERRKSGYVEIQDPMAQGRSTKIISMMKWTRTSRLSVNKFLSFTAAELRHRVAI